MIPEPLLHPIKKRRSDGRIAVTVCVAAICDVNILLGASDRMLTSGDVEFEPQTPKIYAPTNSIAVMIAGDASLQYELLYGFYDWTNLRSKEKDPPWIPIADAAKEYRRIYQEIKSQRAATRVLGPLGLTMESFLQKQKEMAPEMVKELTGAIVNFEMPEFETIIAGNDGKGAHIYLVTNNEVLCKDGIGFAAIGIGYWHANSQFMFAKHNRERPLPESLLLTYAAKKRAEVAPGVGEGTDMFTIGPQPGTYNEIRRDVISEVDKIYKQTRKRNVESVKRSNIEVTKYVEQLGKAGATQEQQTSIPKPTIEKPNGEEGKADSGSSKPN